jgi:hypothetical protein
MALLMRLQRQLKPPAFLQSSIRAFALPERAPVEDENDPKFTVTVNPYKLHNLEDGPNREARKLLLISAGRCALFYKHCHLP